LITLINGPKSVHLKSICRSILDHQKTWNFKEYTVRYKNGGFIVFDKEGNNIYCNNINLGTLNNDILMNCKNEEDFNDKSSLIDTINNFSMEIDGIIQNNRLERTWVNTNFDDLFLNFRSLVSDIDEIVELKKNTLVNHFYLAEECEQIILQNMSEYQEFLKQIKEESFCQIWTGIFSASFIKKIRNDLGNENVRVLNFLRNPSSCCFVNELDYKKEAKYEEQDRKKEQFEEFVFSILNMVMVKSLPGVININYEDCLKYGKFKFDDEDITIDVQITNYNNIINTFEIERYDDSLIEDSVVEEYNKLFSDFDSVKNIKMIMKPQNDVGNLFENYFVDIFVNDLKLDAINEIPKSFFEYLNYTPLNIQQIIDK
jgi:hypothetical protein